MTKALKIIDKIISDAFKIILINFIVFFFLLFLISDS